MNKKRLQSDKNSPIKEFVQNLKSELGGRLLSSILFGSRARGDYQDYSDYDILLVIDKYDKKLKNTVLDCSVNILNKYDALISYIICEKNDWNRQKKFPVGLNIINEGVEI